MIRFIFLLCAVLSLARYATAQTTLNPDISAISDLRVFTHNDVARPSEIRELNLANPEMELNFAGYVNPYTYAVGILSAADGEPANIEELYLTVNRGLPLGLSVLAGKSLLKFGRLNSVHEHAWSFLKRPLPHALFFTDEGLNEISLVASRLLPTGEAYTELMVGVVQGEGLFSEAEITMQSEKPDAGFFGRLTSSFAAGESTELALGVSGLNEVSRMDSVALMPSSGLQQYRSWIVGFDFKLKYHPSQYQGLQVEGEALLRSDDTPIGRLTSHGGYGYLDYRFRRRYNIGAIFELVAQKELSGSSGAYVESSSTLWRSGVFLGFSPVEETSVVRIAGHFTQPENQKGFWEITTQLVFSLGPHKPHNF